MFQLGSKIWPGLGKFFEEATEAVTVCAKLIATGGKVEYWEDIDLKDNLEDELGDLYATMHFLIKSNKLDNLKIMKRMEMKLKLYATWAKEEQQHQE